MEKLCEDITICHRVCMKSICYHQLSVGESNSSVFNINDEDCHISRLILD